MKDAQVKFKKCKKHLKKKFKFLFLKKNSKKPLFVQFILESLWKIYESVYTRR